MRSRSPFRDGFSPTNEGGEASPFLVFLRKILEEVGLIVVYGHESSKGGDLGLAPLKLKEEAFKLLNDNDFLRT